MRKLLVILLLLIVPLVTAAEFEFDTTRIKSTVSGEGEVATFTITNPSDRIEEASLSSNLGTVTFSEQSFSIGPGESKEITVSLAEPKRINSFQVSVTSGNDEQFIPVSVELEDENTTFDSELEIAEEYRTIKAGDKILAKLDIRSETSEESEVLSMTYSLFDYNNNEIFSETQDIVVIGRNVGTIEIDTPSYLTPGRYFVAVVLNYKTEWSTSSESVLIEGEPEEPSLFVNPFVIAAAIGVFIVLIYMFRKSHHHLKRLELAHWSSAFEFRKHRLHANRRALYKRLGHINKHLELGNISKETHAAHHNYITQKLDEIDHILGLK